MTESAMALLRRLLVSDYGGLKQRLARRFGSADFASEVLHEAWLRLDQQDLTQSIAVQNPTAYLYRVALNIATDQRRADRRWVAKTEIDGLLQDAVDDLGPARIAEAREEIQALATALEELTPRRRAAFIASRLEGLPHKVIAARLGINVRIVDREVKMALDQLGAVLNKKSLPRRGPRPSKTS
jgi:RNA polymerase sigma factor (sigma-70 family)